MEGREGVGVEFWFEGVEMRPNTMDAFIEMARSANYASTRKK